MKRVPPLLFFVLFLTFFSCAEEQNFNQFNDLSVIPTVATSIFYFESPEEIINDTNVANFFTETYVFNAFSEDFVAERVLDGTIEYQIENTTSKELSLIVAFLDENDTVLDTEIFKIEAQPTVFLEQEVFYGAGGKNLDILRNTTSMRVTAENRGDNISESTVNDPKIILRSSATFRVQLQ